MSKRGTSPLLIAGLGIGAFYLLSSGRSAAGVIPTGSNASLLPASATGLYGVNSGIKGGNGSFYTVSNYAQLLAADPNLGNPNYVMTVTENAQYLANYLDLQQGLPTWIGNKQPNGTIPQNIAQAAQAHWLYFGCAEKRIFLPMQPPSNGVYIPPPVNSAAKSSGGSSVLGAAVSVVSSAAPYLLALLGPGSADPALSDADLQFLFTGTAIIKQILPFFATNDPDLTAIIDQQTTAILTPYIN